MDKQTNDFYMIYEPVVSKISVISTKINSAMAKLNPPENGDRNYQIQYNKLLLCVSQLQKILLLLKGTRGCSRETVKNITKYVIMRTDYCVNEIENLLAVGDNIKESNITESDRLGRFINKLDTVLHELLILSELSQDKEHSTFDENKCDWKELVDDLLVQAVTVAKISGGVDSNEITATCQRVLRQCKDLQSGYDNMSGGFSMWKLHCEMLSDALMQLERRVSSALLRLLLKVFSDVQLPLKHLINNINYCNGETSDKIRRMSDLDKLVEEFDYHNDCIQHLSLFALAFSDEKKCELAINCCLASLESLDDWLIPAVLDLYMDHTNTDKVYYLRFLSDHWSSEVNCLESLLDGIIDPTAFTTITLQSVQCNLERGKSVADFMIESTQDSWKTESSAYYGILNSIITEVKRLSRHLKQSQSNNSNFTEAKKELKCVTNECCQIIKVPMNEHDYKIIINRTLKRFDLLLIVINKILNCLSTATIAFNYHNNSNDGSCNTKDGDFFQHTTSLLNLVDPSFPSSVKDLPMDLREESNSEFIQSRKIGRGDYFQNLYFANIHKKKRQNQECIKEEMENSRVEFDISNLLSKRTNCMNTLYEPSPRKKSNRIAHGFTPCLKEEMSPRVSNGVGSLNSSCELDITRVLEDLNSGTKEFLSDTVSTIDGGVLLQEPYVESAFITNTAGTSTILSMLASETSNDCKMDREFNRTEAIMADLKLIESKLSLLKK